VNSGAKWRNDRVTQAPGLLLALCCFTFACEQPSDVTSPVDAAANAVAERKQHDHTFEIVLKDTALSNDFSEGLAFSTSGDLYVGFGFTGEIVKVSKTGSVSTFTRIDPTFNSITLGLAFDRHGNLYVAVWGFDESFNGIWRVTPDGHASLYAAMPLGTIPNFIVFDERGDLLVSESVEGAVWRVPREGGKAVLWAADDLLAPSLGGFGANGMARQGNDLFVLNYDRGRIVQIPILPNGEAGTPSLFLEDPRLVGADGMAFDIKGNIYIGITVPSSLLRVSQTRAIETLVTFPEDLPFATNVAFGKGTDTKTAYLTIGDIGNAANVVKVDIGIPGLPLLGEASRGED